MSKIEYAIRNGNYRRVSDCTYAVEVGERRPRYISSDLLVKVNDRIRRDDWRRSCNNYNVEHSAVMSDILSAYDDYKACLAF